MGQIKTLFKRAVSPRYNYTESKYEESFLPLRPVVNEYYFEGTVIRKVYCFWTGDNEMSADRKNAFDALQKNVKVEVVLVTPKNLDSFIVNEHPLHNGYQYLSLIQKSDYLRCYFMHHYGGGYTDIKMFNKSWEPAFCKLEKNPDKWIIGYREIGKRGVAKVNGILGSDLRKNWQILIGNGSFICKPYSPFTSDWYSELHRRMDIYYGELVKNPGNTFGDNPGYPIPWAVIMGHIFHPLCLKYHKHLAYSQRLKFKPMSYR